MMEFEFDEFDNFIFPGFNGSVPFIGHAQIWFDCYQCENATAYRPERCRKCNSMSFERREPRGRERGIRFNSRAVA